MQTYYEVESQAQFDPPNIIQEVINHNARALLFNEGVLPEEFFDLSTGIAGELLHKTAIYRVRLACVVSDLSAYSVQFQAFVREANRGGEIGFFPTRQQAVKWLEDRMIKG